MITAINSKKIFQADPDTGENVGVHIYELVGASTDITGSQAGLIEWFQKNDIPVNIPGAFGNGSTFYAIDTKKKFIFFNGQFYELPTQGGSDPVDTLYDMVVKISVDETFEETGSFVSNYTYNDIRNAMLDGKNIVAVLNIEGTLIVFNDVSAMSIDIGEAIRFTSTFAVATYGEDPMIADAICWMYSDSSIPYEDFDILSIELATAGGGGGSNNVVVTFSDDGEGNVVSDKACYEILDAIMQANPITGYYLNSDSGTVYIFDVVSASEYGVQFESCSTFRNSEWSVAHETVTMYLNADNTVDVDYAYYTDIEKTSYYITHDTQGNIISSDGELDVDIASQVQLCYDGDHKFYDYYQMYGDTYVYRSIDIGDGTMTCKYIKWDTDTNEITYDDDIYTLTPYYDDGGGIPE